MKHISMDGASTRRVMYLGHPRRISQVGCIPNMSMVMRRHRPWPLCLLDTTLMHSYQGRQQEGMVGKRKDQEYV
jgi:hypothetical protein